MFKHLLLGLAYLTPMLATAGSDSQFTVRIPLETVAFVPTTTTYDFGKVQVGQAPQRVFTFSNQSSEPVENLVLGSLGAAQVVSSGCTGVIESGRSCTFTAALAVTRDGANQGTVQVRHSGAAQPNDYILKATGVRAQSMLEATPSFVDFGETSVRVPVGPKTITLKNSGGSALDVFNVSLSEGSASFTLRNVDCYYLEPGETCTLQATYDARAQGMVQGKVAVELEDGVIQVATLVGAVSLGSPSWSLGQMSFMNVPLGTTTANQSITLSNTGKGTLTITRVRVVGDSAFEMVSSTCGTSLAPQAQCQVTLRATARDANQRSGVLQVESTNSTQTTLGVQLFLTAASDKSLLEVSPAVLDFASVPVGASKTMDVTIRSIGTKPAVVNGYSIAGAQAADFRVANAAQCTGSLAPGMECVLQVSTTPLASGARQAGLTLNADTTDPVPGVTLRVSGVTGSLVALPPSLNFGELEVGQNSVLKASLRNDGGASVTISSVEATTGTTANYAFSGCSGQVLMPGATCELTLTFSPSVPGRLTGAILVKNSGTPETVPVYLSGDGKALPPPLAAFGAFRCPDPAQQGVQVTCSSELTSIGTVPLAITSPFTRTSTLFDVPASNCPSSLAPGVKCQVTVTGTFNASGVFSTGVNVTSNAGTLSSVATVTVRAPTIAVATVAHDPVQEGESNSQTHTVTNTGLFAVNLTLPAKALTTSRPTGSAGSAGFAVESSTCPNSLAAGVSCSVVTRFSPDKVGAYGGTLTVDASASGWSGSAVGSLSGLGTVGPDMSANLESSPNPVDLGVISTTAGATRQEITIYNRSNARSADNLTFTVAGPYASEVKIPAKTCGTSLAKSASCKVSLDFLPRGEGGVEHAYELRVTSSLPELVIPMRLRTAAGTLTATPVQLDFGPVMLSAKRTLAVTLVNTGNASVVRNVPTIVGADAARFSVALATCPTTLAPGDTCTMNVTFTPSALPAVAAALTVVHNGYNSPARVELTGSGIPQEMPGATLSEFSCTNPLYPAMPFSCVATLTSTGVLPLSVTSTSRVSGLFTVPVVGCPSPMTQGTSCTVTMTGTSNGPNTFSTDASVVTNAGTLTKKAIVVVSPANVSMAMQDHGVVQIGSKGLATHVVTNLMPVNLVLTKLDPIVSGAPFAYASTTCGASLAPGASCEIVTRCSPSSAGVRTATLELRGYYEYSYKGTLTCEGAPPRIDVIPAGATTTEAGGHSRSGNWYRIRNSGLGPITIASLLTQQTAWTLFADSTDATQCAANRVIQPGQECLVLETLTSGPPGATYKSRQTIRTTGGDVGWDAEMTTYGVLVQEQQPFAPGYTNQAGQATILVTNLAPYPMSAGVISLTNLTNFKVESHDCTTLAAAGSAGSSCTVVVSALPYATAGTLSVAVRVNGAYPQVLNRVAKPSVNSGQQGTATISRVVAAPTLAWSVGTYPATLVGGSSQTVSTLRNDGPASVWFTADGYVSAGTAHSLVSTTCRGELRPGVSCEYRTQFSPVSATASTGALLYAPLDIGLRTANLTGNLMAQSDVAVTVRANPVQALVGTSSTFTTTVTNPGTGEATVVLSFWDGASGAAIAGRDTPACVTTTGGTCQLTNGQAYLKIAARGSATLTQVLRFGGAPGTVTYSASGSVSGVQDPNTANNSSSASVDVVYQVADLSVNFSSVPQFAVSSEATFTAIVSNRSTAGGLSAEFGQGALSFGYASASGGATFVPTRMACTAASTGSLCDGSNGRVAVKPGGSVTFQVTGNVGAAEGTVILSAQVSVDAGTTDPNMANNSASSTAKVVDVPVDKWCAFTSQRVGEFLGSACPNATNGCDNGALSGNQGAGYYSTVWMLQHLVDPWVPTYDAATGRTVNRLDLNRLTWKGTGKKVTTFTMPGTASPNASYVVYPQVQVWDGANWVGSWRNNMNGKQHDTVLGYWSGLGSSPGSQYHDITKPAGTVMFHGPGAGIWTFQLDGRPVLNYTSQGVAGDGSTYRLIWLEKSPGQTCNAPGTFRVG